MAYWLCEYSRNDQQLLFDGSHLMILPFVGIHIEIIVNF